MAPTSQDATPHSVRVGLDQLKDEAFARVKGKRVALLANPAAVCSNYRHLVDHCLDHGVNLVRLFGPEHGIFGDAQYMEGVETDKDRRTGVDVVSLVGDTRESLMLDPKDLAGVDVLVCDLQDIGTRYYTFAYTIAFALRAAAEAGVDVIVLDRPNPLGGVVREGNVVDDAYKSFVGEYPLATRHGLTLGELVHFFAEHDGIEDRLRLEVIWMEGYDRRAIGHQTRAPWVMPSPNIPTHQTAIVYPGGCLLEGTNISEGRGTTRPFELVGAPYITEPERFAEMIAPEHRQGCQLRPCSFRPTFDKHTGDLCHGFQIHVTNPDTFRSMTLFTALIAAAMTFEGFDWRRTPYEFVSDRLAIDLLYGSDRPRHLLEQMRGTAGGSTATAAVLTLLAEDDARSQKTWERYAHAPYGQAL